MNVNILWNNPIANLTGPEFLALFGIVIIAAIVWAIVQRRKADPTRDEATPPVPTEFDPHELAYLRGGLPELTRLMVLDLVARGYLWQSTNQAFGSETPVIKQAPHAPQLTHLDGPERSIYQFLLSGLPAANIVRDLPGLIPMTKLGEQYQQELEQRDLLTSGRTRRQLLRALLPVVAVAIKKELYQLFVAFGRDLSNAGFLIVMMAIGVMVLLGVGQARRVTNLGKRYLDRLQGALGLLRERIALLAAGRANDHLLLAVSVFGIAALQNTAYAFYPQMFARAAESSGGCGSSCGSGCGGGDGGCGGCGG